MDPENSDLQFQHNPYVVDSFNWDQWMIDVSQNWSRENGDVLSGPTNSLEAEVAAQGVMIDELNALLAKLTSKQNDNASEWMKWVCEITAAVNDLQMRFDRFRTVVQAADQKLDVYLQNNEILLGMSQKKAK
ncbi:hypothetical protein M433DRAFT_6913 [Acidomyces richmondensis BFW]|nr:hypothetical protein M433DRAFT_6913 [Acidomyces richmondensis BFW]